MSSKHCSNCGRARRYGYDEKGHTKYICENGKHVDRYGVCDRNIHVVMDKDFFRKCDEAIKRMEPYQEGTYKIRELPPLGTNYRITK